jgi:hypothetical protein
MDQEIVVDNLLHKLQRYNIGRKMFVDPFKGIHKRALEILYFYFIFSEKSFHSKNN